MLKLATICLVVLVVGSSAKRQRCTCDGGEIFEYNIPGFDIQEVQSLQINQFDLPDGEFSRQFRETLQTLIVIFVQIRNQFTESHVDQAYIMDIQNYITELSNKINNIGSLSTEDDFNTKISDFDMYLMQVIAKLSDFTKTIQDKSVQNYYYTLMLQLLSSKAFIESSLHSDQCIYHTGGHGSNGGNSHEHSGEHGGPAGGKSHEHSGEHGGGKGGKSHEHSGEHGGGKGGKSHEHSGEHGGGKSGGSHESKEHGGGKGGKSHERFWSPWSK